MAGTSAEHTFAVERKRKRRVALPTAMKAWAFHDCGSFYAARRRGGFGPRDLASRKSVLLG